jgi:phosphoglycerate kinase
MKKYNTGDRVLLRLDFNVPTKLEKIGGIETEIITNTFRIDSSISTIKMLQNAGCKVIILAHKEEGEMRVVANYLKTKIENFNFVDLPEINFANTKDEIILGQEPGDVILFDNVRNYGGEKKNDPEYAKLLASYGDYYINDAFSASHRKHASIVGIPNVLGKDKCELGPKFLEEIAQLEKGLKPEHPCLLIVGGVKFDTKLPMLEKFLNISDKIFVGGALAHTFWKTKNINLGKSLIDSEVTLSQSVLDAWHAGQIILPRDIMLENREERNTIDANFALSENERVVDFGKNTLEELKEIIKNSKTIIWNGPVDYYEGGFDWGCSELIKILGREGRKTTILGGGDTVTEIDKILQSKEGADLHFTHISTGGGAMIDYLSTGTLPGIEAILSH